MSAELDMYSGRRNPTLTLSVDESQEFMRTISGLTPGPCPDPPGLGYRGVVLFNDERTVEIRLFNGAVHFRAANANTCAEDALFLEKALQSRFGALRSAPDRR